MAKPRSDAAIAEDICAELLKLKPDSGDPRAFILGILQLARVPIPKASEIKAYTKRFKNALKLMGDDCPPDVAARLRGYTALPLGQDDRFDRLKKLCADEAVEMVKHFSLKRPVSTPFGNIHNISQLIFEAATGAPPSEKGPLKACRDALPDRKSSN